MKKQSLIVIFLSMYLITYTCYSQTCNNINFAEQADIPSTCNQMTMTMIHDILDRPYLYVANKEGGVKIYNITTLSNPLLIATLPISFYDSLDVMNISQKGNYLYLALGNTFTNPQAGGMAIVDVSSPTSPNVTDYYIVPNSSSGGGIVIAESDYAYLGAMQSGLVILDISDKNNIQFVSQFIPNINYPPINNPNPNLYNARGMEVKNSIVYLCFDAGGFRIINCTNKQQPIETGRWCNPAVYTPQNHPKAYNNIVVDDTLVYIAVDYCGMEVLNISDTSNITLHGWWNPYNCPNNNWFNTPVHSNEIHYDSNCKRIFLSTGKSDLMVVDVSNPALPDSCSNFGGNDNNMGTWGLGLYQNQIYLSYICAIIPFSSNWTGVKLLTHNNCPQTDISENRVNWGINIFPQPATNEINIETTNIKLFKNIYKITIQNIVGEKINDRNTFISKNNININIANLPTGIYFVTVESESANFQTKFIKL